MFESEPENCMVAIAANGGDPLQQVEAVERQLRLVHAKLDRILCSVESLTGSPSSDATLVAMLREAVEPAAEAIHTGAGLLLERVRGARSASGW